MLNTPLQFARIAFGIAGPLRAAVLLMAALCLALITARAGDHPASPGAIDQADLALKEQALLDEAHYAKGRLEQAQRQLSLESKSGNRQAVEHLEEEVNEWLAWSSVTQARLTEVEKQIAAAKTAPAPTIPDEKTIIPGENLFVSVLEDRSYNGIYQVRRGGYIILPQIGRIPVVGKSPDDVAAAIQNTLQGTHFVPKATVQVVRMPPDGPNPNTPVVYLAGEFRDPRPWRVPLGVKPTLVNAILSSGGLTDFADLTRVRLMRMVSGKSEVKVINVTELMKSTGHKDDVPLSDGDVISIPATSHPKNPEGWFLVVPTSHFSDESAFGG